MKTYYSPVRHFPPQLICRAGIPAASFDSLSKASDDSVGNKRHNGRRDRYSEEYGKACFFYVNPKKGSYQCPGPAPGTGKRYPDKCHKAPELRLLYIAALFHRPVLELFYDLVLFAVLFLTFFVAMGDHFTVLELKPAGIAVHAAVSVLLGGYIASACSVFGHCYPILFEFRGGKGAASAYAMTWCLCWQAALVSTIIAIIVFFAWKRVSLVSILTAIAYLIGTYIVWATGHADPYLMFFVTPVVLLLLIRHKDNIKRLFRGEEKAISSGDKR